MKKTSFRVTKATLELENALIQKMDIPRTTFHRRMIDYYLEYDRTVKPQLLIRKMTDPNYIQKDEMKQIYLDEKREQLLLEGAEEQARVHQKKCGINIVLFQALLTYCVVMAPVVLEN